MTDTTVPTLNGSETPQDPQEPVLTSPVRVPLEPPRRKGIPLAYPEPDGFDVNNYSADYLARRAREIQAGNEQLMGTLRQAVKDDPDTEAIVQRLGVDLGADPMVVRANIDKAKQALQIRQIQRMDLARNAPILWEQLHNPALAALAHDDFDRLSFLERLGRGYDSGWYQADLAKLRVNQMMGIESPEQDREIARLKGELARIGEVRGWVGLHGQMIGQMMTWETAATWGATAGAVLIPGAAPILGPVAVGLAAVNGYRMNAGLSMDQFMGAGMAPSVAIRNANIVGVVGGGIEVVGHKIAVWPFKKAGADFVRSAVVRRITQGALDTPTFKQALGRFSLRWAGQQAAEVGEEIGQEFATGVAEMVGQIETLDLKLEGLDKGRVYLGGNSASGMGWIEPGIEEGSIRVSPDAYYLITGEQLPADVDMIQLDAESAARFLADRGTREAFGLASKLNEDAFMTDTLQMSWDTAVQTIQSSLLLTAPGPIAQLYTESRRVKQAETMQEVFTKGIETVKASTLAQRSTGRIHALLQRQWGNTELAEVHVDNAEFRAAMAKAGVTPEQLAEKLPHVAEQLSKTVEEQPTIVMSGADFFAKLAESKFQEALLNDVKPDAGALSLRQKDAKREEMLALSAEMEAEFLADKDDADAFEKDLDALRQQRMDRYIAAGTKYRDAKNGASLYAEQLRIAALHASSAVGELMLPSELLRTLGKDPTVLSGEQAEASIGDSLRQFIGTIGAERLGKMPSLAKAQDMADQGKSADEIYEETGWFTGPEGKLRMEIRDRDVTLKMDAVAVGAATDVGAPPSLDSVIDHPELFAAYPFLASMAVESVEMREGALGSFSPFEMRLRVNQQLDPDEMRSVLLHEIQHAIQTEEGFARGASPRQMDTVTRSDITQAHILRVLEGYQGLLSQGLLDHMKRVVLLQPSGVMASVHSGSVGDRARDKLGRDLVAAIKQHSPDERERDLLQDLLDQIRDRVRVGSDPFIIYQAVQGEIEARLVQDRADMTDEERAAGGGPGYKLSGDPFAVFILKDDGDVVYEARPVEPFDTSALRGQRSRFAVNLSSATSKLRGISDLTKAAGEGSQEAADILQSSGAEALRYLLSGIESARVEVAPVTGLYGGSLEPALGLSVTFGPKDRAAVLAVLERFAQAYAQEQVHVRQDTADARGTTYPDGSYAAPTFIFPLTQRLTKAEIDQIAATSGLAGFTVNDTDGVMSLEAYHVTDDPTSTAKLDEFLLAINAAERSLHGKAGPLRSRTTRLWSYGTGWGAHIPYGQIAGDVRRPSASATEPRTADRIIDWLRRTGGDVAGAQTDLTQVEAKIREEFSDFYKGRTLAQRDAAGKLVPLAEIEAQYLPPMFVDEKKRKAKTIPPNMQPRRNGTAHLSVAVTRAKVGASKIDPHDVVMSDLANALQSENIENAPSKPSRLPVKLQKVPASLTKGGPALQAERDAEIKAARADLDARIAAMDAEHEAALAAVPPGKNKTRKKKMGVAHRKRIKPLQQRVRAAVDKVTKRHDIAVRKYARREALIARLKAQNEETKRIIPEFNRKRLEEYEAARRGYEERLAAGALRSALSQHNAVFENRGETRTKSKKGVPEILTKRVYDGVQVKGNTDAERAQSIVDHLVKNGVALFLAMDPLHMARSRKWYEGANKIATAFGVRYGITMRQVAAMLASLSPQADWRMNVSYVERMLDLLTNDYDTPFSAEATAWFWEDSDLPIGDEQATYWRKVADLIEGRTLRELEDQIRSLGSRPTDYVGQQRFNFYRDAQALWIRAMSEAHHDKRFRNIAPEGEFLGWVQKKPNKKTGELGGDADLTWSSMGAISNALMAYYDESMVHEAIGSEHKVRNFFHNILDPTDTIYGFGTSDTHHVAAMLLLPLGSSAFEVEDNLGGTRNVTKLTDRGLAGTYFYYHEALKQGAAIVSKILGTTISPREFQSVTWEAVRGLFTPEAKRDPDFVNAVRDIWTRVDTGEITQDDAIQQIFAFAQTEENGGDINDLDWIGSVPGQGIDPASAGPGSGVSFVRRVSGAVPGVGDPAGRTSRSYRGSTGALQLRQRTDGAGGDGRRGGADLDDGRGRRGRRGQLGGRSDVGDVKAEFRPADWATILHTNHDVTSLVHELGHFTLELHTEMWRAGLASVEQIKHMQTLIDELGEGRFATIEDWATAPLEERRKLHERVAYLFEDYMATGKAPNQRLRAVFHYLAQWFTRLYGHARRQIDAGYFAETGEHLPALSDEVRMVFDRWLATADEVRVAQRDLALGKLLQDQAMTPAEEELIDELVFAQEEQAQRRLRALHRDELKRLRKMQGARYVELQRAARAERKRREAEEEQGLLQRDRVARVAHFLQTGRMFVPSTRTFDDSAGPGPHRLWTDDKRIPQQYRTTNRENGIDAEELALEHGFVSAESMFEQLDAFLGPADTYREAIAAEVADLTDERMLAEVPHLADEELMRFEIDAAIANEAMLNLRAAELALFNETPAIRRDLVRVAKEAAMQAVGRLKVSDLFGRKNVIRRYNEAARRAEIEAAAARGDVALASQHQRTAIMQRAMALAAVKRREALTKLQDKLQRILRDTPRAEECKAKAYGGATLDTARLIAHTLGLPVAMRSIANKLEPWLVLDKPGKTDEVSPERTELEHAFQDARDAVAQQGLLHEQSVDMAWDALLRLDGVLVRGKLARTYELDDRKVNIEQVKDEIRRLVEAAGAPMRSRKPPTNWFTKNMRGITAHFASTQRLEPQLYAMDEDRIGTLHQLIFAPIRDAEDRVELRYAQVLAKMLPLLTKVSANVGKQPSLHAPITTELDDAKNPFLPDPDLRGDKGQRVPHVFDNGKLDILGCLLHAGNKSNLDRLMLGFQWGERDNEGNVDHTPFWEQVNRWERAGVITADDWRFVQGMWDIYEQDLLPGVQRAHYELVGNEMEIMPKGLPELGTERLGVKLTGGYVPAAREKWTQGPTADRYGQDNILEMQRASPAVFRGMTKQRVDQDQNDPLDIDPLRQLVHFRQGVMFSEMGPVHRKVSVMLRDRDIEVLLERLSPGFYEYHVRHFLQTAASLSRTLPGAKDTDTLGELKIVDMLRTNYSTAVMFGHVVNATQGFTGAILAAARVKPRYLSRALFEGPSQAEIYAMSPFLETRHKLNVTAFEMQQQIIELTKPGGPLVRGGRALRNWLVRNTYWLQELVQKPLDRLVWRGAYIEATESLGYTEAQAVQHANQAVRATQSDTAVTSMAKIEKGGALMKLFMQFSGWFISLGSLRASPLRRAQIAGRESLTAGFLEIVKAREVWAGYFTLYMGELIGLALSSEDEEEKQRSSLERWATDPLWQTTLSAPRAVGPVGIAMSAVVAMITRSEAHQQRMPSAPVTALIDQLKRSYYSLTAEDREPGAEAITDMTTAVLRAFGLPAGLLTDRLRRGFDVFEEQRIEPSVRGVISGR